MRASRGLGGWFAALFVTMVLLAALPLNAQTRSDDRAWYQRLTDGMASLVYWAAWPTATYQRVAVQDIDFVVGGAIVTFRLHGKSAWADGDLWVDVKLGLRPSGEVTSLEWGDYNGFFPPGFTWQRVGEAMEEINRRNHVAAPATASPRPIAPAPSPTIAAELTVVCLSNATTFGVNYSMKWGSKTEQLNLPAGNSWRFWAPANAGTFEVTFDSDLTQADNRATFNLRGVGRRGEPTSCSDDMTIDFVANESRLSVQPRVWSPGSAHPFIANVVAGDTKENWRCAPGFKWALPDDQTSLECLDARYGYVGVTIVVEPDQAFPRITRIIPGSSAELAGIAVGMYIVSVDGSSTEGLSSSAVVAKIRGAAGTSTRIGVAGSGGAPRVYTLPRR